MPKTGDYFITTLKRAHLEWGSYRHTDSREIVYGEGYLQIPRSIAINLKIYNNNSSANATYAAYSNDGFLNKADLLAAGSMVAGDEYAKQFQGSGNLKLLGSWYQHINAQIGDKIKVEFLSPTEILLTKL